MRSLTGWLAAGICLAAAVMAWLAFRATQEWRHASELLTRQRTEESIDLFVRALVRDMRGVEESVLRAIEPGQIAIDQPYEISSLVATAFARYPYPESFFRWDGHRDTPVLFFARSGRRPPWLQGEDFKGFPVTIARQRTEGSVIAQHVASSAAQGRRLSVFETELGGQRYQVVARLLYKTPRRDELDVVFGFVVNLGWVRREYFPKLLEQIGRVVGAKQTARIAIRNEDAELIAGSLEPGAGAVVARRVKPLFFDFTLEALTAEEAAFNHEWTVQAALVDDPALGFALRAAHTTLAVTAAAAVALGVGLVLTGRAMRASTDLAKVRLDFVSSVTHELKTPLTTIRTVGEAFLHSKLSTAQEMTEYGQILDQEAKRLIRLVDNILAYSRVTDVSEVYAFEALSVPDVMDDVLRRFHPQFNHEQFAVSIDIDCDVPLVRGDLVAVNLVFDNLIDNALRYSDQCRMLDIKASYNEGMVWIRIRDHGVGIAADELENVLQRFVRGRYARSGGSGLGLAIVSRIVEDHRGRFSIESKLGEGTTVTVALPAADSVA